MVRNCLKCHRKFETFPSRVKLGNGKYCSHVCSNRANLMKENPSYASLHEWVNNNINKPKICGKCGSTENIDLANITGIYNRDFSNWDYLCRRDHMRSDDRLRKFIENRPDVTGIKRSKETRDKMSIARKAYYAI